MRALLVALLLAGLAAEEIPAGTPVQWEAGKASLASVLGRLAAGGNRVWLADGIDDAVEAEVPAVAGVWWDGVIATCRAFGLRPDEGEPSDEQVELPGTPTPVGHGTLVLSRGPLPGMQSLGVMLAALDGGGDLRLWLRAEPRVARGSLAWARADPPGDPAGRGTTFETVESAPHLPPAATWHPSAPLAPGSSLALGMQTAGIGKWTGRCTLAKAGETVRFTAAGKEIAAAVLVDAAPAEWEGHTLPERRPLVALSGPTDLLQKAFYRVRQGESELGSRGNGSRGGEDGKTVLYRYLRAAPEGAVELDIEGRMLAEPTRHQLQLLVPAVASASASPIECPTPLAWEAGSRPLSQWLGLLAASGNPVLPEVGVDTAQAVAVPAVRGGFWDGLQAVASAAGLAPALAQSNVLAGGAVRLVRRPPSLASATSGPLLVDIQSAQANRGELTFQVRLALEPRLSEDGFAPPEFRWASWATDEQGRVHELVTSAPPPARTPGSMIIINNNNVEDAAAALAVQLPQVTVRLAAAGAKRLEISGLVTLPRLRVWRGTAELVADQPCELLLGPRAVEITALTSQVRIAGNQIGPGLLLRGVHGAAGVQFSLVTAEGQALEASREANRMGGGPLGVRPWLGWCRIPPQGRMTAEVAVRASQAPLVLPLRLTVPVPDGL